MKTNKIKVNRIPSIGDRIECEQNWRGYTEKFSGRVIRLLQPNPRGFFPYGNMKIVLNAWVQLRGVGYSEEKIVELDDILKTNDSHRV